MTLQTALVRCGGRIQILTDSLEIFDKSSPRLRVDHTTEKMANKTRDEKQHNRPTPGRSDFVVFHRAYSTKQARRRHRTCKTLYRAHTTVPRHVYPTRAHVPTDETSERNGNTDKPDSTQGSPVCDAACCLLLVGILLRFIFPIVASKRA